MINRLALTIVLSLTLGMEEPALAESASAAASRQSVSRQSVSRTGQVVTGQAFAPTPCSLTESPGDFACIQVVVPLKVKLAFRRLEVTSAQRYVVTSDAEGNFRVRLPRGRYTVRLLKVSEIRGNIQVGYPVDDLRVSPEHIQVVRGVDPFVALSVVQRN
jgi:hypothetical protein